MFVIASSMSASVGCGFLASNAAAAMIWPDWQQPHCDRSSAIQARCTACARFLDRPSIVVTRLLATAEMGSTQVRVATPSRCTVQAPHCAMPQPNLVPVRPSVSRSTQRSGVSGVTLTVSRLPFTVKEIGDMTCFLYKGNGEQRAQASREMEGGMPGSSCAETVRPIPEFLLQRRLAGRRLFVPPLRICGEGEGG